MLTRFAQWQGQGPESVAATRPTGTGSSCTGWRIVTSLRICEPVTVSTKDSPFYGPERFTYQPESNSYCCPAGQQLNYGGRNQRNRTYAYIGTRKRCGACALKAQCTSGAFRYLATTWMNQPGNAHGSWRTHQVREGPAAKKEGGSLVRGTQESDRTASLAPAEAEVRAGAVLPGSGGAEHQATGPVPQPSSNTPASWQGENREELAALSSRPKSASDHRLFQHPRLLAIVNLRFARKPGTIWQLIFRTRNSVRWSNNLKPNSAATAPAVSPVDRAHRSSWGSIRVICCSS